MPEGFDGFDFDYDSLEELPYDGLHPDRYRFMNLKPHDRFSVGGIWFKVLFDYGIQKTVTKDGTRGRKIYYATPINHDLDSPIIEVYETSAGGTDFLTCVQW